MASFQTFVAWRYLLVRERKVSKAAIWVAAVGLELETAAALPPAAELGLTVKIWTARRPALAERSAA